MLILIDVFVVEVVIEVQPCDQLQQCRLVGLLVEERKDVVEVHEHFLQLVVDFLGFPVDGLNGLLIVVPEYGMLVYTYV
jgi:hypothetical protein